MYKHLFGPVPSRRLGMSLGVDLIPHKVCTLNCTYCECGCTTTLSSERKEYVPVDEVYKELRNFFENNPDPDYITFSGAGEPTLHSHLGEVIAFLKQLRPDLKVAVLSNGTLFHDPNVRSEILQADLVLPSLDAATEEALRKINRPAQNFDIEQYIQGLLDFSEEFQGEIWMEVLILPGYNDDRDNLSAIRKVLQIINPTRIQLNTLDRPGTVKGLRAATHMQLAAIAKDWDLDEVEIIAAPEERKDKLSYRSDLESVLLETISRRPCTLGDLGKILGMQKEEIINYLATLEDSGKIETVEQVRGTFYQIRKS